MGVCEAEVVLAWYRRFFCTFALPPETQFLSPGLRYNSPVPVFLHGERSRALHSGTNHGCEGGSCAGCEGKADVSVRATFRIHTHIDDTPRRRWEGARRP